MKFREYMFLFCFPFLYLFDCMQMLVLRYRKESAKSLVKTFIKYLIIIFPFCFLLFVFCPMFLSTLALVFVAIDLKLDYAEYTEEKFTFTV